MSALPRRITQVYWKNSTMARGKRVKVRIRVNRKLNAQQVRVDQFFDSLEQAKDLLATYQSNLGRQTLNKIELEQSEKAKRIGDLLSSQPISFYSKQYVERNIPEIECDDLKRRRRAAKLSFFKMVENTATSDRHNEVAGPLLQAGDLLAQMAQEAIANAGDKRSGDFKPEQTTYLEINDYTRARLFTLALTGNRKTGLGRSVPKISVSRELAFIKKLFEKLRQQEIRFKNFPNPVTGHHKDLLKKRGPADDYRLSDADKDNLFKVLDDYPNREGKKKVSLLSCYCGFRRNEIVPLLWEQVRLDQNYVQLYQTKSGRPRKVIITKQAREIFKSIPKRENDPRLFTYTLFGVSGSVDKMLEQIGPKKRISFPLFPS